MRETDTGTGGEDCATAAASWPQYAAERLALLLALSKPAR